MSHPLLWPKLIYFYPIGNTSAVCLTHDLAPEKSANILLLGCGDPRNILYTIYSQTVAIPRKLDFTCCDMEAAVLARNVLLFTMLADNKTPEQIHNIFFHVYLDRTSLSLLLKQCRVLIDLSETLDTWHKSKYSTFLKVCTSHTLSELRRYWSLYAKTEEFSSAQMKVFRKNVASGSKMVQNKTQYNLTACRSAGPLWTNTLKIVPNIFQHYWKTGTTSTDPKEVAATTFPNPTFAYSASGERFAVHYGTDPILPFHLAPIFASGSPPLKDVIDAVKAQFQSWCEAFKASISPSSPISIVIRMFTGDALEFSKALRHCAVNTSENTPFYTSPWSALTINLDGGGYADGQAPMSFDVIDTSNLLDHIGLLNVLVATIPLLSVTPSSTLYIEALLSSGEDATKGFQDRLCGDIAVISLILGLVPASYISKFNTCSNTHEVVAHNINEHFNAQFHERIAWKHPTQGDTIAVQHSSELQRPMVFDASDLGSVFFGIYLRMFADENIRRMGLNLKLFIHYIRETFVLLLKLVKERVETDWNSVMDHFFQLLDADRTLLMGSNNYQDLCGQLHLHGVYTVQIYQKALRKVGRFKDWDLVPPIVCVVLIVPRKKLKVLEDMGVDDIGTPIMHCDTRGAFSHNIYSSIRVAFGRITPTGPKHNPAVDFEEDPAGWSGASPLVVSFRMPAWSLTAEPQDTIHVSLSIRSTPATVMMLMPKLGIALSLFSAKLTDERYVHVVAGDPTVHEGPKTSIASSSSPNSADDQNRIGRVGPTVVALNTSSTAAPTLTVRMDVEETGAKSALSSGATVKIEQISPCAVRVAFKSSEQELAFPFPISGSRSKVRIARKSFYIEVVVPVLGPSAADDVSFNPFPVVIKDKTISLWNIHRVNLSRLPVIDTRSAKKLDWYSTHMGSTMSDRERSLRDADIRTDTMMDLKNSLHTILVSASGYQGPKNRVFSLVESSTRNSDTLIFITDLRLDVASHTVVANGYVLPLTHDIMPSITQTFGNIVVNGRVLNVLLFGEELRAWKQILPAFTERCREWEHTDKCEYLLKGAVPLSEAIEETALCSCGKGKDGDEFVKVKEWRKLAPYVTRIALGPLFAVSYLDSVGARIKSAVREMSAQRSAPLAGGGGAAAKSGPSSGDGGCMKCGGPGKPKLLLCGKCRKVNYCSEACQKEHWRTHKLLCRASTS